MKNKIESSLIGVNGNAFALMGHFKKEARSAGWSREEIAEVIEDATSGDYNHLVCVLVEHFMY